MHRPVSDWGGNLVAFAIVIALNVLSNALPINGQWTPGGVPRTTLPPSTFCYTPC